MRLASFLMCVLFAGGVLAGETEQSKSNVLGKECPELLLEEEMVQGEKIDWDTLRGKVVLFLFYQRECEGSERYAMPRIQKLHEKYTGSGCWLVFVVNTAFDKDIYPHLADVDETRKHLRRMDWTMPVARDLDEQSNALFTLDEQSGTPQAIVMDEHGIVRAHDWYAEEEEMKRVDNVFETLAAGMNCHCVRMPREVRDACKPARDAFAEGNYRDAYDKADTISKSYGYEEKDKADADYLKKWIDETASTRIERITRHYDRDPEAALARADEAIKTFDGVTGVNEFATAVQNWRDSEHLANFRTGRKDLGKIEDELSKADNISVERRKDLVDRLTSIADRTGKTIVAENARQHIERLTGLTRSESSGDAVAGSSAEHRGGESSGSNRIGSSGSSNGSNRIGSSGSGNGGNKIGSGGSSEAPKIGSSKSANGGSTATESSRHRKVRQTRK